MFASFSNHDTQQRAKALVSPNETFGVATHDGSGGARGGDTWYLDELFVTIRVRIALR
jgi:hypothetical protein